MNTMNLHGIAAVTVTPGGRKTSHWLTFRFTDRHGEMFEVTAFLTQRDMRIDIPSDLIARSEPQVETWGTEHEVAA
jgi:hypothetical protein